MAIDLLISVFLAATSPSVASTGPDFATLLAVARMDADCAHIEGLPPCVSDPAKPKFVLNDAFANADFRIEQPAEYVDAFRSALAKFLLEERVRPFADAKYSVAKHRSFQSALNALGPYYACLENRLRSVSDDRFFSVAAIDSLATEAANACAETRARGLNAIAYHGPDFAAYDPIADANSKGAETADLLSQVQKLLVAYNAGLRGKVWRHAIQTTILPRSSLK